TVYVVDLATRESTELSTLLTPNWGVMSWSPDGEWVILYVASRGVYAHRVDGSAAWEIEQPRPATPYWLASGGVLLADVNFRDNTQVFEGVKRLDLATGAVEILDVDLDAFNADPAMIYDIAAELGETLVEPIPGSAALQVQFPDEMNDGMNPACARWQITRGSFLVPVEEQELVYNAPDVYGLSEVRDMPDGSIVFIQWEVDECRIVNRPVGTLMRLVPGEAPGHLLDGVFGGYKIGREWEYFFGPQARVALSPDGRTAAWLGGTSDDGTSSLNLTDLDGGAQVTLRDARGPAGYDESFINGQMYSAVYWLPS
ncbi:MAG: hypothetical protein JW966_04585, partial [Anaerolineae bacterium]|nr:hypothetical protein [Anaerolineae bacterium]